jgi:hypothetical protein
MLKKIAKILFGLALVPFCLGFARQFVATFASVSFRALTPYYFLAGCMAYLAVHFLFKKPILTYVFGHELTHAFFAVVFGGAVKSIHAGERGGRVTVTKSNFIITLAPYFFPLYTVVVLSLYGLARAASASETALHVLVFLAGACFTFHLALTWVFLLEDQADIREHGAVFSYPLIFLFNILFAAFLVQVFLAERMEYLSFLAHGIMNTTDLVASLCFNAYELIRKM